MVAGEGEAMRDFKLSMGTDWLPACNACIIHEGADKLSVNVRGAQEDFLSLVYFVISSR